MALWSDEEREYRQDCREKAITARSARHKRTHCGKGGAVKFPSDYLTAKERKAMNGEIKTYNINKPMTWAVFKELPKDLQVGYIKMLRHRFNTPDTHISGMFGCSPRTLSLYLADAGISHRIRSGREKWAKDEFNAWCNGEEVADFPMLENTEKPDNTPVEDTPVEPVVPAEPANAPEQVMEDEIDILVPESGQMTFKGDVNKILKAIKRMLSNSNVELTVNWTVVKED